MKKKLQVAMNNRVLDAYNWYKENAMPVGEPKRLDSCQAWIQYIASKHTGEIVGTQLISYNTVVAFTVHETVYDVLRYVYGYTATSARHIAKYRHSTFHVEEETYRPV